MGLREKQKFAEMFRVQEHAAGDGVTSPFPMSIRVSQISDHTIAIERLVNTPEGTKVQGIEIPNVAVPELGSALFSAEYELKRQVDKAEAEKKANLEGLQNLRKKDPGSETETVDVEVVEESTDAT